MNHSLLVARRRFTRSAELVLPGLSTSGANPAANMGSLFGYTHFGSILPSSPDSPLEGAGFEPSVPLLRKALLGVANRRRRHEGRSHLQVQARDGNACLEWLPIAFPFAEGPRVRIRLPPAVSQQQTGGPVLAQGRQLHPSKPTTPCVTSIGSSVPIPVIHVGGPYPDPRIQQPEPSVNPRRELMTIAI